MHTRMSPEKSRALRWTGVVAVVGLFVWYRIEDPVAAKPLSADKPVTSTEQQRAATRLAVLGDGGASIGQQRAELQTYLKDSGVSLESIETVLRHIRDGIALREGHRRRPNAARRPAGAAGRRAVADRGGRRQVHVRRRARLR